MVFIRRLFLRAVFGKENYSESVLEELQWVAENLATEKPEQLLVDGILEELSVGNYVTLDATEFQKTVNVENAFKQIDINLPLISGRIRTNGKQLSADCENFWMKYRQPIHMRILKQLMP